jgi:hypothetical protein
VDKTRTKLHTAGDDLSSRVDTERDDQVIARIRRDLGVQVGYHPALPQQSPRGRISFYEPDP